MTLDIAPHVQRIHGIDISEKMIDLANQKVFEAIADNIQFIRGDAFNTGLATNSFSARIAFNVIHLLDYVPKVLARLGDLLTSGGILISQTPCVGEASALAR